MTFDEIEKNIQMLRVSSKEYQEHARELANIANQIEPKLDNKLFLKEKRGDILSWKDFSNIIKMNFDDLDKKLEILNKIFLPDMLTTFRMLKHMCDFTEIIIFYNKEGDVIALYYKGETLFINIEF